MSKPVKVTITIDAFDRFKKLRAENQQLRNLIDDLATTCDTNKLYKLADVFRNEANKIMEVKS